MLKTLLAVMVVVSGSGCAASLNSLQKRELAAMKSAGVAVEEKSPGMGAALGILPGFGSFYVGSIGPGIANLLLWPFSILWDPVSGYEGSLARNYDASKHYVKKLRQKEETDLEDQRYAGEITDDQFRYETKKIATKYDFE